MQQGAKEIENIIERIENIENRKVKFVISYRRKQYELVG